VTLCLLPPSPPSPPLLQGIAASCPSRVQTVAAAAALGCRAAAGLALLQRAPSLSFARSCQPGRGSPTSTAEDCCIRTCQPCSLHARPPPPASLSPRTRPPRWAPSPSCRSSRTRGRRRRRSGSRRLAAAARLPRRPPPKPGPHLPPSRSETAQAAAASIGRAAAEGALAGMRRPQQSARCIRQWPRLPWSPGRAAFRRF
jgi:hypothetical protein